MSPAPKWVRAPHAGTQWGGVGVRTVGVEPEDKRGQGEEGLATPRLSCQSGRREGALGELGGGDRASAALETGAL